MYGGHSVQYKIVLQNKFIDLTQFVKSKFLEKKVLIKIRNGPEDFFFFIVAHEMVSYRRGVIE